MSEKPRSESGEVHFTSHAANLVPQAETPVEHVDDYNQRFAAVRAKLDVIEQDPNYPVSETGNSNFYDVTHNLSASAGSYLDYLMSNRRGEEVYGPNESPQTDAAQVAKSLKLLEAYTDLVHSHPSLLKSELSSEDGAFPQLRLKADEAHVANPSVSPVEYYVQHLANEMENAN
jgi:hypothetical protein